MEFLPLPGTPIDELNTPALLIDLPTFEANIAKLHGFFKKQKAKVRPHTKGHRCPQIAHIQLAAGGTAGGICVGNVSEAEVMAFGGVGDSLITNQVVTRPKILRLMQLLRYANVKACVDNPQNVADLSEAAQTFGVTLGCVVEVDIGIDRAGVKPGKPALELAKQIVRSPGLRFEGLQGYEGGLSAFPDFEARATVTRERIQRLLDTVEVVEKGGLPVRIVSGGGTGTWNITGAIEGVTEVQAGGYIFMDLHYRYCPDFDISLRVLGTVVSRPRKGLAVTDCGHKVIGLPMKQMFPTLPGFTGMPEVDFPRGAKATRLNAEHGVLELESAEAEQLRAGDKVFLVPAYNEVVCAQHDYYIGVRNGKVETVWPITARGAFT